MPLEGLWWADDMTQFSVDRKEEWRWTMMMMQPEQVTESLFAEAVTQVQKKKNPAALSKIRFEAFAEGRAAQIMHLGPLARKGRQLNGYMPLLMNEALSEASITKST